jgi:hypothetical protein
LTWIKAIEAGHFTTWPGLTADLVRKHLPKSIATTKATYEASHKASNPRKPNIPTPIRHGDSQTSSCPNPLGFHEAHQNHWTNLQRSNWPLPNHLDPRKQIHHGRLRL